MERYQHRQLGVVMLSALGVLGLMSLMIVHIAQQTLWLSQSARQVAQQQDAHFYQSTVVATLYRFDLSRVVGEAGGSSCYPVDEGSCLCVVPEPSAADTWRFALWRDEDPDRALLSGWMRGAGEPSYQVIAIALGKPAAACLAGG